MLCTLGAFCLVCSLPAHLALDKQDRIIMEQNSPRTVMRIDRGDPLTLNDVIKLTQYGVNDQDILQYMQKTDSVYFLTQTQIQRLKEAGVSQKIIAFMTRLP